MGNCLSVSCSLDALLLRCWDCAAQRGLLVCQLEDNISALKKARDELVAQRDDVKRSVLCQEGPEKEQICEVQNWVVSVENVVAQVDELLQASPQEVKKLCLGGCCSKNCKSSYKFGVAVAKKLDAVEELKKKKFGKVVDTPPPTQVVQQNVGHTVGMEKMLDEAMGYLLGDDQVENLVIWGMGGVGKTTLLKQINNKFGSFQNDYFVIFITVSNNQVDKLQEDIWKKLSHSIDSAWKEKTCQEKAQAIFNEMSKKKFVLLLDDVWKPIKLADDIGVPENRNGSKVVIATRDQDVCSKMGTIGREIKIKPLELEEAWKLFCKMMGEVTLSKHQDIPSLARDVVKECVGLPIAIITIARAMAPKSTPQEWTWAIRCLREYPADVGDVQSEVLYRLKFSYDNLRQQSIHLPKESIQSCFLYCCLFPEDFEIDKDDLIDYWICEEFCSNRDEGHVVIGTLVRACLLLEEGEECVKLHDVIRDMALWITSKCEEENEKFLVEAGRQLTEIVEIEKWKGKKRISFMENNIDKVKGAPTCPNLLTLLLNKNSDLKEFDGDFFRCMDALRVLDLSKIGRYGPVVPSQFLIAISKLTCLQYLNLSYSNIKELPPELKMLVKLKYLNIEWCGSLTMIPKELIRSLQSLQVLRMFSCGSLPERVEKASILCNEFDLIEELKCLKDLNVLRMTLRKESTLEGLANVLILRRSIQALYFRDMNGLKSSDISTLVHMEKLKELFIYRVNILEVIDGRLCSSTVLFHSLQRVNVYSCEHLLDLTWLARVPKLTSLEVSTCSNVREIISAKKLGENFDYGDLFAELKSITFRYLHSLESIYVNSLTFPFLQLIWVEGCSKLKKLPLNSNSAKDCKLQIRGPKDWWNGLEWEDDTTKATFSSSFFEF